MRPRMFGAVKPRGFRVSLVLISLLLLLPSLVLAGPWSNHRYDAAHTAYNATESFNPATLAFVWSQFVGNVYGSFWSLPVVAPEGFFVGVRRPNGSTYLRLLRRSDGAVLWSRPIPETYIPTSPVVAQKTVFIGGVDPGPFVGYLYAFDMLGNLLWKSDPTSGQYFLQDPVVVKEYGLVYVAASGFGGDIFAFSVVDGKTVWSQPVINGSGGSPAVSEGMIFATYPGQYYGFDALTGAPLWHRNFGISGGGGTTPTAGEDLVYMVDRDWPMFPYAPTVFALNKDTGAKVWLKKFASTAALSDLALTPTALFLADGSQLRVLDPTTGHDLWSYTADEPLVYSPVVAGDYVFVASANKTYAIHIPTQAEVWSTDVGGKIVVANRWVLITEADGWMTVFKAP